MSEDPWISSEPSMSNFCNQPVVMHFLYFPQAELMCEDLAVGEWMTEWSEARLRDYFERGGEADAGVLT